MTLKEIHSMFEVGQTWEALNTRIQKASGKRTLAEKQVTRFVWRTESVERRWMDFPKASHIIEARPGYLQFNLVPRGAKEPVGTLTLTKIEA